MSGTLVAFLGFAAMLVLIAARMPVGLAMLVTGAAICTIRAGHPSSPI
jgi:C4-dicarboxylate transporter, DctM subunit